MLVKILKRTIKWTVVGLLILLVVIGLLFGLAQTGQGKRHLSTFLSSWLSRGPNVQVKLGQINGFIPFWVRADRVTASDQSGVWASLENVFLRWSPRSVLLRPIRIRELRAERVQLSRWPKEKERQKPEQFTWPPAIPSLVIEQFALERLHLREPLLGEEAVITINGRMDANPILGLEASFDIERTEGALGQAAVSWTLKGKDPVLTLRAKAEEAERGLLMRLLGFNEAGHFTVNLEGEGPIQAWEGKLKAKADKVGAIEASFGFTVQKEAMGLTGEGVIQVGPSLLPRKAAALFGGSGCRFGLDLGLREKRELEVNKATFETDKARLMLEGRLDLQEKLVGADFRFGIEDPASIMAFTDNKIQAQVMAHGRLSGSLQRPKMGLTIVLQQPEVERVRASKLEGELRVETLGVMVSPFPGWSIEGKGWLEGLSLQRKDALLPERDFQWSLDMTAPGKESISIRALELLGQEIMVRLSGRVDPRSLAIGGNARVEVKDLKRLSGIFGFELSGETQFRAALEGNVRDRSVSAEVEGQLKGLMPIPSVLASLSGPEIAYKGRVALSKGQNLTISDLHLDGADAKLSANASLDLVAKNLNGRGRLEVPQIAVLSESTGRSLSGAMDLEVDVEGPIQSPRLLAKARGYDLVLEGIPLKQVTATLQAEGLPARPQGDIQLSLLRGRDVWDAKCALALNDKQLLFSNLSIAALGAQASGDLSLDIHDMTVKGSLEGRSEDLSSLSSILGDRIGGKAWFKTQLNKGSLGQDIALELRGREVVTRFGQAETFELRGQLGNVFDVMEGEAQMEIRAFRKDKLALERVLLKAKGRGKDLVFSGHGKGHWEEDFEIQTKGSLTFSPGGYGIQLDQLQGHYGKFPVALTRPMAVQRTSTDFVLKELVLRLGTGNFHASGRSGRASLLLEATAEDLPLHILRFVGVPDLLGSASGEIRITGRPDRPEGDLRLHIKEIRLVDPALENLPPASIKAEGKLRERHFRADLSVEGLAEKPFRATFEVPVNVSFSPPALSLQSEGELRGQLLGEFSLAPIPGLFLLEDQSLGGIIVFDLDLAGNAENPQIKGKVQVLHGAYENGRIGTILRNIQIRAKVVDDRLVLEEARWTDGGQGTILAQGWLKLLSRGGSAFEFDVNINDSTLLRGDNLTVTTGGRLSLSGSGSEPKLSGDLTVGPAEMRIPDRLPPEVSELEVVEVNRPAEKPQQKPKGGPALAKSLQLDLGVEIPGRVFVRGRGLDSEWGGALRIVGNAHGPSITGNLSVIRGRFNLFGKRLTLTRGDIVFYGATPPSPRIDVTAENKRSDFTARLKMSGTPSALTLELESDPPLPSDEILSHLLFGRGVANLTPFQALSLAQAVNALAGGGGALDFMGRTRKFLGVDQLDIKESETGEGGTTLSVGKYLFEDVYVDVEQGLKADSGKVSVEVELTPNISVESELGLDAQAGFGFNWRWDY